MAVIFGADPGLTGGIAVFKDGGLIALHPIAVLERVVARKTKRFVDPHANFLIFDEYKPDEVFIERVGARPMQGTVSMFSLGYSTGVLHGLSAASKISTVEPVVWKRHFGLLGTDKKASRELAMQMFPDFSTRFRRVKDDGLAESALIGAWGLQNIRNV
jgi:crossover junction endodeoxyribonuclease RuvC